MWPFNAGGRDRVEHVGWVGGKAGKKIDNRILDAMTKPRQAVLLQRVQWFLEQQVEGKPVDRSDFGWFLFGEDKNALIQINMTSVNGFPMFLNELYDSVSRAHFVRSGRGNADKAGMRR